MSELPRFSRSVRATTNLEIKRNLKTSNEEKINLQLWRSKESVKCFSWREVKRFIQSQCNEQMWKKINLHLTALWSLTCEIIGTETNSQIVDNAAIFTIRLFLDERIFMMKHFIEMKKIFGPITQQTAAKICSIVQKISQLLNDNCRNYLKTTIESDLHENTRKYWGQQIHCKLPDDSGSITFALLQDLSPNLASRAKSAIMFSMKYDKKMPKTCAPISSNKNNKEMYSRSWLARYVNPEHINSLIELLKSEKTNDELQNDLFELLGFTKFDIIQKIFENRSQIIEKYESSQQEHLIKDKLKQDFKSQQGQRITTMVVQSEQEKILMKQLRKQERKFNKLKNTVNKDLSDDEDDDIIDTTKLKCEHQEKLLRIMFSSQLGAKSHVGAAGSKIWNS